jgi:predicted O-methyltransferase YrrM
MSQNIGNIQPNYQQLMREGAIELQKYNFQGEYYRLANFWFSILPLEEFKGPINYLEIGAFNGGNVVSIAHTYCNHKDSKMYCIDPWGMYDGLMETGYAEENIYRTFMHNTAHLGDKVVVMRGTSSKEIIKLEDNFFDIIYIDGNHEPEYVLEDAVLSMRKLKIGGYLVFDDYGWGDVNIGIDSFLTAYDKHIQLINMKNCQLFLRKIKKV